MPRDTPLVGLTLDAEPPGGYSKSPWYAIRANYMDAIAGAGAAPLALPHLPGCAEALVGAIDALVITGGAFDIDPSLYGGGARHQSVTLKQERTDAELAFLQAALTRGIPVLGICGGEQLLAAVLGGSLIQHIPDAIPHALAHEQRHPHTEPGHEVTIEPGTLLHRIVGAARMRVNTSHHQAVASAGPRAVVNARAPDGVIEGVEDPERRFCLGVQWHPEYLIDPGDIRLFAAFVAAAREGMAA